MATRADVIKALQDEFEYFVNGHSNPTMAAARAFERIRSMIGLDGERMTYGPRSTADPRVGLTFEGTLNVGPFSDGVPELTMIAIHRQQGAPQG